MKKFFTLLTSACLYFGQTANSQILNELYTDPGAGNHEFFELFNTNPTLLSVNNLTLVTFFDISGQKGFYVMDLPNMSIASRGYFVGSAALPFNFQGKTNSTLSDFDWNSAAFFANQGYLKKWVQGGLNLLDGNLNYDEAALPANFNDFFYRRVGSGFSYSVFLYNNGQLINTFIGGSGGSTTLSSVIVNMPSLFVNMTGASPDFTINFSGYGSLPLENVIQDAGSDNGYIRTMDGACGTWDKSSSTKQHTPKTTNGTLTGTTGTISVASAISRGTPATGSTVNYDVVGASSSLFPIEMQVYTDMGSVTGQLDGTDPYIASNTETVITDGPFYTNFFPYSAHILIAVKTNAGCLDKIIFIPNSIVLSTSLVSFEGNLTNNDIRLNWRMEANENADRFEVQWSTNGTDFTRSGIVSATGKTGSETYSYITSAPVSGKIIYRLIIFNKSGKVDYSNTLVFQNKEDIKRPLTIINNPVNDKLTLSFQANASQVIEVKITDMSGRLILREKANMNKGTNLLSFPVHSGYQSGVYIVALFDGTKNYTDKFVKQ